MSSISNRFIIIAVSLLVTIAITSSIMIVIGYYKDVYAVVGTTDISIRRRFTEYDMYDNTIITGMDALNLCNKYKSNPTVNVYFGTETSKIRLIDKSKASNEFNLDNYHVKFACAYKITADGITEIYLNRL